MEVFRDTTNCSSRAKAGNRTRWFVLRRRNDRNAPSQSEAEGHFEKRIGKRTFYTEVVNSVVEHDTGLGNHDLRERGEDEIKNRRRTSVSSGREDSLSIPSSCDEGRQKVSS